MEVYDYDAAARTIEIEDITSDEVNRNVLRRLKENDPDFVKVVVCSKRDGRYDYCLEGPRDLAWLGHFIGKNTHTRELTLYSNLFEYEPEHWSPRRRGKQQYQRLPVVQPQF